MQIDGRSMIKGVDISNWQNGRGPIDYRAVAADGVVFMVAKASEGAYYTDPYYAINRDGWVNQTGRVFSAYHWLRPNHSWQSQVDRFLDACEGGRNCNFLTLDAEQSGITDEQVVKWCDAVHKATGLPIAIYCGAYTDPRVRSVAWLKYTPWIASYTANYTENPDPTKIPLPKAPEPWKFWDIWQYTSSGYVNGIQGKVDINVADVKWLNSLLGTEIPTEDDDMAVPFFQRTSNGNPHLIFPNTGIRKNFATLDGVTGEKQVSDMIALSAWVEKDPAKRIVEKGQIKDPKLDYLILRSYTEVPSATNAKQIAILVAQLIEENGSEETAQAVIDLLKEQFNK